MTEATAPTQTLAHAGASAPYWTRLPNSEPFAHSSGPRRARVAVVGESWGYEEAQQGIPLVGQSGQEFTRMLIDAGLDRDGMFLTNVVATQPTNNDMYTLFHPFKEHPPNVFRGLHPSAFVLRERDRLLAELSEVQPEVIVAAGNYALWALSDLAGSAPGKTRQGRTSGVRVPTGIARWRGSMVYTTDLATPTKLLPIIHPAAVLRNWGARFPTVHDLRTRVRQALEHDWEPGTQPTVWAPPTFDQAVSRLKNILARAVGGPVRLACDIETKRTPLHQFMTCIGFCDGPDFAMSIPFIHPQTYAPYWSLDQETELVRLIYLVLCHPNVLVEGQNFVYDLAYLGEYPGVILQQDWDSLLFQHVLWPGTPKSLDYLSSLYCRYHRYWKDDNKEWDEKGDLLTHLRYNAEDNLRTYEIVTTQRELLETLNLHEQWNYMKRTLRLALKMMRRGMLVDNGVRHELRGKLIAARIRIEAWLSYIVPQEWTPPDSVKNPGNTKWFNSPAQTMGLFLSWGLKVPNNRKSGNPSVGKEALAEMASKHPGFKPLFERMLALRSLKIYSDMLNTGLERDNRLHTNINPAGAETFRFSSSKNPFGRAMNMQNVPVNIKPLKLGELIDDLDTDDDENPLALANPAVVPGLVGVD